jgi:uncharacterized membrane protein
VEGSAWLVSEHPPPNSKPVPSADLVRKVELFISALLRIGVISSLVVVVAGLILSFVHHPDYRHSTAELKQVTSVDRPTFQTLTELVSGIKQFRGEAIIMLGLLLLIATPVMRVAVSVVAFMIERDWTFVLVTTFVLAMLILSFFLGKTGV